MFSDFLISLRRRGVPVGTQEWLALHRALGASMIGSLDDLYGLGRAILIHSEGHYDDFDLAFAEIFKGVVPVDIAEAIQAWLENPIPTEGLSPEAFAALTGMSLDELRKRFEEMLREQKERHDGGSRYIGTGGTSPYGSGGQHPSGVRVGAGGGRSAVQVAENRRFRNYRTDVTIDVRQFKQALKALRSLGREGDETLALDPTIRRTCDQGGEIELVFERERKNTVELLLMMDAGGSMDPFASLVDRLFSAAAESSHWKRLRHTFFHNVPYDYVYGNIERLERIPTTQLFRDHSPDTMLIFVGDACMAPWELTAAGGALSYWQNNPTTGLEWLRQFRQHFKRAVWLNPESTAYWGHPTIELIGRLFPMFPLSLDGLSAAVKCLCKDRFSHGRLISR